MDHIDEFESMFRRAEREPFRYAPVPLDSITFITDRSADETERRKQTLTEFLPAVRSATDWRLFTGDQFSNVSELLETLNSRSTDLIVTYRHLRRIAVSWSRLARASLREGFSAGGRRTRARAHRRSPARSSLPR